MMSVPGFQKRGGGMMILSRFCYKPEDVDCRYCLHYRRRSCQVRTCPYIAERLKSGAIEYLDLILEYFGHIPHAGLHKRIQAVEHWSGPDQAVLHTVSVHLRSRFADRVWDDAPPGYLAALYLLASKERLWQPALPALSHDSIDFSRIVSKPHGFAIQDYRCLYDVDVEDSEQFQKLQKLAERTEALSPAKAAIFSGALDAECVWNLEGALTVADRLDEYMLVNNVSSDSELGIYLVNKGIIPFPDRFKPYINYARVGAEYREKHGGEYSSGNYVQKKTPELLENERLDGVFRIWMENPCPVRVQSETAQITLPATFEQLESARQLLGVDSLNMAKLTRVEALRPYLGEYLPLQGMDLRLEQLDELAENIRIMDQEDGALLKYLSVLEVEQPATLQEALRFSIELDDYERVPDDPEEYGKQVLERIGADEELISTLDGFTDFEAMGNFYMREDGVRRTEFGLLRKLSDPFPEVQDGLQMH